MADVTKHSPQEKLRIFIDSYGVGVRAGVLTPNLDDETAIRAMFGLPPPNDDVKRAWAESNGVRFPITLAQGLDETASTPNTTGGKTQ